MEAFLPSKVEELLSRREVVGDQTMSPHTSLKLLGGNSRPPLSPKPCLTWGLSGLCQGSMLMDF